MKQFHIMHYLVLGIILVIGVMAFCFASPNSSLQLIIGIVTSVAYVCWGFIHHAVQKDLHQKIVVEYILIGAIAVVLLATILKPW
jgi:ABC-type proline/glycine betaine transport system permease subunit